MGAKVRRVQQGFGVKELQQRFHALLEPELMGAMSHSDSESRALGMLASSPTPRRPSSSLALTAGDKVRQLAGLLQQADQHDSELERLYVGARIVSLQVHSIRLSLPDWQRLAHGHVELLPR